MTKQTKSALCCKNVQTQLPVVPSCWCKCVILRRSSLLIDVLATKKRRIKNQQNKQCCTVLCDKRDPTSAKDKKKSWRSSLLKSVDRNQANQQTWHNDKIALCCRKLNHVANENTPTKLTYKRSSLSNIGNLYQANKRTINKTKCCTMLQKVPKKCGRKNAKQAKYLAKMQFVKIPSLQNQAIEQTRQQEQTMIALCCIPTRPTVACTQNLTKEALC